MLFHQGLYFMLGLVHLMIIPAAYTMNPRMTVNMVTMPIGAEWSVLDQESKSGLDEVMLQNV